MIRFKRLLLFLMVIEKIRGVRNCLIVLTRKVCVVRQRRGVSDLRGAEASQEEPVLLDMSLSCCQLNQCFFISRRQFAHLKSFSSPIVYVHLWHCSSMVYLNFSLT